MPSVSAKAEFEDKKTNVTPSNTQSERIKRIIVSNARPNSRRSGSESSCLPLPPVKLFGYKQARACHHFQSIKALCRNYGALILVVFGVVKL